MPLAPPRASRLRRVLRSLPMRMFLLVAIFAAGSVTGWSVGSVWSQRSQEGELHEIMKNPRPRPESLSDRLTKSLELTEPQSKDVEQIIRRHHSALEKIRQQVAPLYVGVFDEMDQEMQAVLSETQRDGWKKKASEMRAFWASGRPPGRPPGGRDRDRSRRSGGERPDDHSRERPAVDKPATDKPASDK
jgi:hypothetical protein